MPFISRRCFLGLLRLNGLALIASIVLVAGCATAPEHPIKIAPRSIVKELGLPNCTVSIPMSPDEVVDIGRKANLYPNPEKDPKWLEMVGLRQPGDELRLVSCSVGTPYFFALIRRHEVIFRYRIPMID